MSFFDKFFTRSGSDPRPASPAGAQTPAAQVPRYPPTDTGLPVIDPALMLAGQKDLVRRMQISIGLPDPEFERLVLTPLLNLARFYQALPMTRDSHHRGEGGAFRFALEVGFYALQASEGAIFTGLESSEKRRVLEPRWRYATFLAGLCTDLHIPLTDMMVLDADGQRQWSPYTSTLYDWCRQNGLDHYYLRWQPASRQQADADLRAKMTVAAFAVGQIIPADCIAYLSCDNARILPQMMAVITGAARPGDNSTLFAITSRIRQEMIDRDVKAQPDHYGRHQLGSQLEPHLLDAMRRLVRSGKWQINTVKNGRVFYNVQGLFILWPLGAREIVRQLQEDEHKGIPQDEDSLAILMAEAGIAEKCPDGVGGYSLYWHLHHSKTVTVLRLADPCLLFPDTLPDPMEFQIVADPNRPTTPAPEPGSPAEALPVSAPDSGSAASPQPPEPNLAIIRADPTLPRQELHVPVRPAPAADPGEGMQLVPPAPDPFDDVRLEMPVQVVLRAMRDYVASGCGEGEIVWTERGLAISAALIKTFGIEAELVINNLWRANWLYVDPFKPGRLRHEVLINGEKVGCMILLEEYGVLIREKPA